MAITTSVLKRWNAGNVNGIIYKVVGSDTTPHPVNIPGGYLTCWINKEGTVEAGTVEAVGTLGEGTIDVSSVVPPHTTGGSLNSTLTVLYDGKFKRNN